MRGMEEALVMLQLSPSRLGKRAPQRPPAGAVARNGRGLVRVNTAHRHAAAPMVPIFLSHASCLHGDRKERHSYVAYSACNVARKVQSAPAYCSACCEFPLFAASEPGRSFLLSKYGVIIVIYWDV